MTVMEALPLDQSGDAPRYYQDARGHMIPVHLVKPADLLEDQLVRNMMERADGMSAEIAAFKAAIFADVGSFLALLEEKHGAKRGGIKGNMSFTSYDGKLRVQVAVADRLTFGAELQVAKTLVDECIADWGKDANDNIRVLVDHAFRTDKEGQVSRESIFALRRIDIDDARWKRAMAAIADSIRVESTKTYVRFHRRDSQESRWRAVTLDLASA